MRLVEAELVRDRGRIDSDALDVSSGRQVVVVDRAAQPVDGLPVGAAKLDLRCREHADRLAQLDRAQVDGRLQDFLVGAPLDLEPAPAKGVGEIDAEVVGGERLRQVPVRPELERRIRDGGLVVARDHDDGDIGAAVAELGEQVEARLAGKLDVAQDDRVFVLGEERTRLASRRPPTSSRAPPTTRRA